MPIPRTNTDQYIYTLPKSENIAPWLHLFFPQVAHIHDPGVIHFIDCLKELNPDLRNKTKNKIWTDYLIFWNFRTGCQRLILLNMNLTSSGTAFSDLEEKWNAPQKKQPILIISSLYKTPFLRFFDEAEIC